MKIGLIEFDRHLWNDYIAKGYLSWVFSHERNIAYRKRFNGKQNKDFIVLATTVNRSTRENAQCEQEQTPEVVIYNGLDILSSIEACPVDKLIEAVKFYQQDGWKAYLNRVNESLRLNF